MIKSYYGTEEFIKEWEVKEVDLPRFFEALGYDPKDYGPDDCYVESFIAIQDSDMEDFESTFKNGATEALLAMQKSNRDVWIDVEELYKKEEAKFGKFTFTGVADIEWSLYLLDTTP